MKIIQPYAKLVKIKSGILLQDPDGPLWTDYTSTDGLVALKTVEAAARISHRSEDKITVDSYQRILKSAVIDKGDWSVTEHVSISVLIETDRGITHELVRHRLFGFTQESTRFVNYDKKYSDGPMKGQVMFPARFVYPKPDVECEYCLANDESLVLGRAIHRLNRKDMPSEIKCAYDIAWLDAIGYAENQYKKLLADKWRTQEARSVLPNALASMILVTGNLRNWRHVLNLRTTNETHPQFRQIWIPLLESFKKNIPILFDDIEPNIAQATAIRKGR